MATINLIAGVTGFYAPGATLQTANLAVGDAIVTDGYFLPIASIDSEERGYLAAPCPNHAAGTGKEFTAFKFT